MGMMFGGGMGMNRGPSNEGGFGGIPPELGASVAILTEHEPEPKRVDIDFVHSRKAWTKPLTFRVLLGGFKAAIAGIFLLVVAETFSQQVGPRLVQYALDHGIIGHHDFGVVKVCVALYVASVVVAVAAVAGTAAFDSGVSSRNGLFTSASPISWANSSAESCSSRSACCSCGVSARCWRSRKSSAGDI